ncbi:hypothetical protein D0T24_30835 [Duganella sp. BJB480]|nr:hypothetical protein D0T26_30310 [Duganella sp. BJB489]RFP29126.1 hypothetical protein D0T24_30835 [Duganella sp. BJB480]
MAAQGASVSYRDAMDERDLIDALSSGHIERRYFAHICAFLDEVPLPITIMACGQVAQLSQTAMTMIWKNVAVLAHLVGSRRATFWDLDNY